MEKINEPQTSAFGEKAIGVWQSDEFRAAAFKDGDATRLSIVRHDLKGGLGWDDLQRIKNACGFADKDAVEFYPAEKDVINTGNLRHLYIFDQPLALIRRHGRPR